MTEQQAIPGLEVPIDQAMAHIVTDVEATIANLTELELIQPRHQALVGMVRLTARKLAAMAARGQAYGVAMLLRELREGLAALPAAPERDDDDDAFAELVAAVRAAEIQDAERRHATD
jgi:hypothetical protein